MAPANHFRTGIFLLLLAVIRAQAQNVECSVANSSPSIEENNPRGIVVTSITAASGVTVTIDTSTTSSEIHPDWFEIKDSQLILNYSVDYEVTSVVLVILSCTRNGVPVDSIVVVLNIINLNDNPPVFPQTNITVRVNENTELNTVVVPRDDVIATDADNDIVFYKLTGNPPGLDYFNIQGVNNPQIYLQKTLDYEKINFTELYLYAMDGEADVNGTHTATATITVYVIPSDLRPPWFQPCTPIGGNIMCINRGYSGKVNVSEQMSEPLNLEPGPLYAIDGDKALGEKIIYEIAYGNDNNVFSINNVTGNITMDSPVNTLKTFILYVVASQANNPFKYSQTTVEIKVRRRNDHKPSFVDTPYIGTVSVHLPASSLIMKSTEPSVPLKIFAADKDFADQNDFNPNIIYQIYNSTDFSVTRDGFIQTTAVLNLSSTITFLVIANDTDTLQETSTLITVEVTPLPTTTFLPTTTVTSTSAIATTVKPVDPNTGTTTSKPSGTSSNVPPGRTTTVPVTASGFTKPTTALANTTKDTGLTRITESPTTSSQSQSPNSLITGTSQATVGTLGSTPHTSPQSGDTKPSTTSLPISTGEAVHSTTKHSVTGVNPGTESTRQSTAGSSSQSGPTRHPITGGNPGTESTKWSTAVSSSQSGPTRRPTTGVNPATHSTQQTTSSLSGTTNLDTSKTTVRTIHSTVLTSSTGTSKTSTANGASETSGATHLTNSPTKPTEITTTSIETQKPGDSQCEDDKTTVIAVGATLGTLLAIMLILLLLVFYKYWKMRQELGGISSKFFSGFSNDNFQDDETSKSVRKDNDSIASSITEQEQSQSENPVESSQALTASDPKRERKEVGGDTDTEKEVKSILTKDKRLEEDGYKAVWFKDDIDPEAKDDVVMIEEGVDNGDEETGGDRRRSDEEDTDDGRDSSEVSFIPGRPQLLENGLPVEEPIEENAYL